VLSRFATVRRKASASPPAWIEDAIWIEDALRSPAGRDEAVGGTEQTGPCAFESLFTPMVARAEVLLWSNVGAQASSHFQESARACLRRSLIELLSDLATPAIYERFAKARKANAAPTDASSEPRHSGTSRYDQFVADMKAGGFRSLFENKPVLLRLMATVTRQWIDVSRELVLRLASDLPTFGQVMAGSKACGQITRVEGDLSDPHNGGHSVQIISFENGTRIVYKPKDLRLDASWDALVERLNRSAPPIELKAARAVACDGYGWAEFVDHTGCVDENGCKHFFQRAGAWLALFHFFAASDMHQENIIAAANHPVPIDLETVFQTTTEEAKTHYPEDQAFEAAMETVANSIMAVGLLPAYGRAPDNTVFAMGGLTADWNYRTKIKWNNINSDEMRPTRSAEVGTPNPNLPHVGGRYAKFGDYVDDFISGFESYARFLLNQSRDSNQGGLFDGFAGISVRKVIRLTRFYYMLLMRLKDHRSMEDGVLWSVQADFIARLAEWENDCDPLWPLQKAERSALLTLNVPYFVMQSDGNEIRDATGASVCTQAMSGMERARARVRSFDEREIAWQIEVIRANTNSIRRSGDRTASGSVSPISLSENVVGASANKVLMAEADKIAEELAHYAIRRGPSAAWIGLDWLGDAEVFQLVCLGPDLYNGASGIALFLAAHAAVTESKPSSELALAAMSHLRKDLRGRNAARQARALGLGGGIGLGSVIYALTVMSEFLHDPALREDAHVVAELITDDLIAADKRLDVIGGSAGAILGLLRLYRDSQSADVLQRAVKCGEHLIHHGRIGPQGRRSWVGQGFGPRPLNGMSHGAAGFAYALASLAAATKSKDFEQAASECIAFENSSYDAAHNNWPDLRGDGGPRWPCQWCHGAPGIGLARLAMMKVGATDGSSLPTDIQNALEGTRRAWPNRVDTLCCGTLGTVEFLREAGRELQMSDLSELGSRYLQAVLQTATSTGDYRWDSGKRRFNLGLFRGLAGVGYTLLRQVDASLPNVLIWE
jgi:type 2 lantibiotic biosynthesis protein LanM